MARRHSEQRAAVNSRNLQLKDQSSSMLANLQNASPDYGSRSGRQLYKGKSSNRRSGEN